jgi:probable HAF family extracellular repeat protein
MKRATAALVGVALVSCTEVAAPPTSPTFREIRAPHSALVTPSGVTYTLVDLGLPDAYTGEAVAINDAGQIAFTIDRFGGSRGLFRWQAGVAAELPSLGGAFSYAWSIGTNGDIVGWSTAPGSFCCRAALWRGNSVTDLGVLPGDNTSLAIDVNDQGQVIGNSSGAFERAFIWQGGVMTELPGLPRANRTDAADLNRHGDVVGTSREQAVLWRGGALTVLTNLPGTSRSQALHINDAGQIAGYNEFTFGTYHAVRWTNGVPTDLGTLGGAYSWATSMNELGDVVGYSYVDASNIHGFLWRDGRMIDLGDLGYPYSLAHDVNDRGQVTGVSMRADGEIHAFLWENGVMTDMGTLGGRNSGPSTSRSMNNSGAFVGSSSAADGLQHPALWDPNSVKTVTIDIKPGGANSVNPKSNGVIPVAILSVAGFDATTVDVATVKFGPGNAAESHTIGHIQDANGDGVPDMVLHFDTKSSGIACGATSATLTGKTVGGQQIKGSDAVVTVGCK